jgi:hypothetical protein
VQAGPDTGALAAGTFVTTAAVLALDEARSGLATRHFCRRHAAYVSRGDIVFCSQIYSARARLEVADDLIIARHQMAGRLPQFPVHRLGGDWRLRSRDCTMTARDCTVSGDRGPSCKWLLGVVAGSVIPRT